MPQRAAMHSGRGEVPRQVRSAGVAWSAELRAVRSEVVAMLELPSGTVTFLFTDIEGSTPLAERLGDRYGQLLVDHRSLVRAAVAEAGGVEVDCRADEFFAAFTDAAEAVKAALAAQRAFQLHQWPNELRLGVRMG